MKYLLTYLLFAVSVFAQTTIKPLTQANIEAAITDKPGFVAEIGAGGTVDNAAVNAAIAENESASRAALELGTAALLDESEVVKPGDDVTFDSMDTDQFTVASLPVVSPLSNKIWYGIPNDAWLLTGGTVAATAYGTNFKMVTAFGSVSDSTVIVRSAPAGENFPMQVPGAALSNLNMQGEIWVAFRFAINSGATPTTVLRGWVGPPMTTVNIPQAGDGNATARGIGFKVTNLGLRLVSCAGAGVYQESASDVATLSQQTTYHLLMRKTAAGEITASLNGTSLTGLSGGPTTSSGENGVSFSVTTGATAGRIFAYVGQTIIYTP